MRVVWLAALLASMFVHKAAFATTVPLLLKPSGKWIVEFAENKCLLGREFGTKKDTLLVFEPEIIGNDFLVMIVRDERRPRKFKSGAATVTTSGKPRVGDLRYSAYSSRIRRMVRTSLDGDVLALSDLNATIEIDAKDEGKFAFDIPGIAKTLPVVSNCLRDLRASYKISEKDLAAISIYPEADLISIFDSDDYPNGALMDGKSGDVGALYWVERDGRVSTCEVIEKSGVEDLDKKTCAVIQRRARFKPARNSSGNSVRSPGFQRVRWRVSL